MPFLHFLSPQLYAKYYCLMATPVLLGPAIAEAIYTDPKAVKAALQAYAGEHGYSITVQSSSDRRVFYICSKGGNYDAKGKDPATYLSKQRKNTSTIKTDCKHRCVARKVDDGWKHEVLENNYNYRLAAALSALLQYRIAAMIPEEHAILRDISVLGYSPTQILDAICKSNPESNLIPRDIYNLLASMRIEELDSKIPIK
jgi:hypothetical protein